MCGFSIAFFSCELSVSVLRLLASCCTSLSLEFLHVLQLRESARVRFGLLCAAYFSSVARIIWACSLFGKNADWFISIICIKLFAMCCGKCAFTFINVSVGISGEAMTWMPFIVNSCNCRRGILVNPAYFILRRLSLLGVASSV